MSMDWRSGGGSVLMGFGKDGKVMGDGGRITEVADEVGGDGGAGSGKVWVVRMMEVAGDEGGGWEIELLGTCCVIFSGTAGF